MSAQPFSVLYPMIRPYCKRVTNPGMDQAIIDVSRDLCLRTKFRRISTSIDVIAGQRYYDLLGGNADEEVVLVEAAQYNNQSGFQLPLTPIQPEQGLDYPNVNQLWPSSFWLEPPSQIALYPIPVTSVAMGLFVRCVLQPTKTATTLDSMLIQQCDDTISYGVLGKLLLRNDEPWSNPRLAETFGEKYERGVAKAMYDVGVQWQPFNQSNQLYRY